MTALENIQATARARRDIADRRAYRQYRRTTRLYDIFYEEFVIEMLGQKPRMLLGWGGK